MQIPKHQKRGKPQLEIHPIQGEGSLWIVVFDQSWAVSHIYHTSEARPLERLASCACKQHLWYNTLDSDSVEVSKNP